MNIKKLYRILSSDILIADTATKLEGNEKLQQLAERLGLKPGGKKALTKEQFDEMTPLVMSAENRTYPGGSSANVLVTLSKLMGEEISVDFIGRVGQGPMSTLISQANNEARINLLKPEAPQGFIPQAATSYVLKYPNGQRTIATYPGNIEQIMKPELITPELVSKYDALLVQGSLWEKFDPAFASRMLKFRWEQGKELWLALPTRSKFGVENKDLFQFIVPSANVVLANMAELARVSGIIGDGVSEEDITQENRQASLVMLQKAFRQQFHDKPKMVNAHRQVGFITDGEYGSYVVTKDDIKHFDTEQTKVVSTGGAGDTAFAGFLYGYLNGLSHDISAQIAMKLAAEKVKIDNTRLPDPKKTLETVMPKLGHLLADSTEPLYITK